MPLEMVPAGRGKALRLAKGQSVKLVNTYGTQVVDAWAWNARDPGEWMSMEATRVWNQRLNPALGDTFVTNRRNPILTLVEDTSPGVHDSFMAACDRQRYERLGVDGYHRNCVDNQIDALAELGVEIPTPVWASLNVFMNIRVQPDGRSLATLPTVSRPGDHVVFRADMECIVAFSSCPQDIVGINGEPGQAPKDVAFEILDRAYAEVPTSPPWVPSTSR